MTKSKAKLLAKLALALASPVVFLAGVELLLRLTNTGYPTAFLVPDDHGHLVANPFFGYRFFDPRIARNPFPIKLTTPKPPGVTRIAVLGESAAMGDPSIEFSLARGLEKMMNEPGVPRRFEVINAAMTAINSHVIVEIARDLARYAEVDIFLLYIGNNEVVGPFGPGTMLTERGLGPAFTPLRVRLTRLRFVGLLKSVMAGMRSDKNKPFEWNGMEMFRNITLTADHPALEVMYRQYEENLERIFELARTHDIAIVAGTMAVNLSDSAPFGSTNRADLAHAEARRWNSLYREGGRAWHEGDYTRAYDTFLQAAKIDDSHAELNYRSGLTAQALNKITEAADLLQRARDLDTRRFRTDSHINQTIRRFITRHPEIQLADAVEAFGIDGHSELFVDHVHFSMPGLYRLCRTFFDVLDECVNLPAPIDETVLMQRLMRTAWSDRKDAALMNERRVRPPFQFQWGNQAQIRKLSDQAQKASDTISTLEMSRVIADFVAMQALYPEDFMYGWQLTHVLCVEKRWNEATITANKVLEELNMYNALRGLAALAEIMSGRLDEAVATMIAPGPPYGHYVIDAAGMIADSLMSENRNDDAKIFMARLLEAAPQLPGREQLERRP